MILTSVESTDEIVVLYDSRRGFRTRRGRTPPPPLRPVRGRPLRKPRATSMFPRWDGGIHPRRYVLHAAHAGAADHDQGAIKGPNSASRCSGRTYQWARRCSGRTSGQRKRVPCSCAKRFRMTQGCSRLAECILPFSSTKLQQLGVPIKQPLSASQLKHCSIDGCYCQQPLMSVCRWKTILPETVVLVRANQS